jgi:hypothetical protein
MNVTAANLLREMASFVSVEPSSIRLAEKLGLNTNNSAGLRQIVEDWGDGVYDEDPDYVVSEIENLLN